MDTKPDYKTIAKLFGSMTAWIVIPLLIARFVGFWLDGKFHTKPWLFVGCMAIAFLISMIGIFKQVKKYGSGSEK